MKCVGAIPSPLFRRHRRHIEPEVELDPTVFFDTFLFLITDCLFSLELSTLLKSHPNGSLIFFQSFSELLRASQSFSEFLANQSEDNSVYMSFQSALFHIEARKGSFNSNSQALRA